jgi:hypothetical protein
MIAFAQSALAETFSNALPVEKRQTVTHIA